MGTVSWRVGTQTPRDVYEADRPICRCLTPEDAERIVAAMNDQLERSEYNDFMRDYMRARHGRGEHFVGRGRRRAELMAPKLAEFQKIILAGDYGTVSAAAERVGVSRMTGHLWARKILAQSATKGGK